MAVMTGVVIAILCKIRKKLNSSGPLSAKDNVQQFEKRQAVKKTMMHLVRVWEWGDNNLLIYWRQLKSIPLSIGIIHLAWWMMMIRTFFSEASAHSNLIIQEALITKRTLSFSRISWSALSKACRRAIAKVRHRKNMNRVLPRSRRV